MNLRNTKKTSVVSGPAVARVLRAVEDLVTVGHGGEISATVSQITGYCESTVDAIVARAWLGERSARHKLKAHVRGAADESDREVWRSMEDVA